MTVSVTSPITGAAQTGFTSPTYTLTTDIAPDVNGKQWAVTALGGTQTGVTAHSTSSPFTITATRPKTARILGKPHPVTGLVKEVPMNVYGVLTRKGATPLVDQPVATAMMKTNISIPAGSDSYDPANLRAMISAHIGALSQIASGLGDTAVSNIL